MKKIIFPIALALAGFFAACNGAPNKTGGATRDSSASHGNGGPADSSKRPGSNAPLGGSAGGAAGSDTTHTGKSAAQPTVDSAKHR